MKKGIVLSLLMVFIVTLITAQGVKVQSAYNYLKSGQLDKAKEAIDEAITNAKTMSEAKTWFYRGNIHLAIQLTKNEQYKKLDTNAVQTAYDSYQKAIELDPNFYTDAVTPPTPMQGIIICGEQFYNKGVEFYNKKNYTNALAYFEKTIKTNKIFGRKDTLATYNAAVCSELLGDKKKAEDYFLTLVKLNYREPNIYAALSKIYLPDTTKALKIMSQGRKVFPDDLELLIVETNIYLSSGKIAKAQENLKIAIAKDPNNANLYFAVGNNYDQFGDFVEAEKAYKKAMELKTDYSDAIFNLGILYFNEGVKIFGEADKLDPIENAAKFTELQDKFKKRWTEAQPYLEKALELTPDDLNTIVALRQLYSRTNQTEKFKVIDEKYNSLKKK